MYCTCTSARTKPRAPRTLSALCHARTRRPLFCHPPPSAVAPLELVRLGCRGLLCTCRPNQRLRVQTDRHAPHLAASDLIAAPMANWVAAEGRNPTCRFTPPSTPSVVQTAALHASGKSLSTAASAPGTPSTTRAAAPDSRDFEQTGSLAVFPGDAAVLTDGAVRVAAA